MTEDSEKWFESTKSSSVETKQSEEAHLFQLNADRFLSLGIDLADRILYINDAHVTEKMASTVIKAMVVLDKSKIDRPITILMNCIGGDEYSGLAIYDAIKSCKSHTRIIVYGQAFSMGAWILQAAKERLMTPFSKLMIHMGYMGLSSNHPEINKRWMEQWSKDEGIFENILLERMRVKNLKYTRDMLRAELLFDTIYNAEESVKKGLADGIFNGKLADL